MKITKVFDTIRSIRDVNKQVENLLCLSKKAGYGEDIVHAGKSLSVKLTSIEKKLMQTKNEDPLDTCNFPPQLDSQFIYILNVILSAEAKPTDGAYERFDDLKHELAKHLSQLKGIFNEDLVAFNDLTRKKNILPVIVPIKKQSEVYKANWINI